jgi:hypothetical protein
MNKQQLFEAIHGHKCKIVETNITANCNTQLLGALDIDRIEYQSPSRWNGVSSKVKVLEPYLLHVDIRQSNCNSHYRNGIEVTLYSLVEHGKILLREVGDTVTGGYTEVSNLVEQIRGAFRNNSQQLLLV